MRKRFELGRLDHAAIAVSDIAAHSKPVLFLRPRARCGTVADLEQARGHVGKTIFPTS